MGPARLDRFMRRLAAERRVVLLGGLAVIAHGYSRSTHDADVWLEPMSSPAEWAGFVDGIAAWEPGLRLVRLPYWQAVADVAELAAVADEIGMVRLLGLECPLDLFRRPNELEENAFEQVWAGSSRSEDGTFLPHPVDVLLSKDDSGRGKDFGDQRFLEEKIRAEWSAKLIGATTAEAEALLARYADHAVCAAALQNPDPAVQALARGLLEEMAAQGDWFSRDVLAGLKG